MSPISRGFESRRRQVDSARVPPCQHVVEEFPVLSAGSTPHTPFDDWTFQISGALNQSASWTWDGLLALPAETPTADIHCVTARSKLDTTWTGVAVDTLLEGLETEAEYEYGGEPLDPEHGGPARLLVPHLNFWKIAKWVRGLELLLEDARSSGRPPATTTAATPWQEQRYEGD